MIQSTSRETLPATPWQVDTISKEDCHKGKVFDMKVTAEGSDTANLPLEEMKWNRGCCVVEKGDAGSSCPTNIPQVREELP